MSDEKPTEPQSNPGTPDPTVLIPINTTNPYLPRNVAIQYSVNLAHLMDFSQPMSLDEDEYSNILTEILKIEDKNRAALFIATRTPEQLREIRTHLSNAAHYNKSVNRHAVRSMSKAVPFLWLYRWLKPDSAFESAKYRPAKNLYDQIDLVKKDRPRIIRSGMYGGVISTIVGVVIGAILGSILGWFGFHTLDRVFHMDTVNCKIETSK